MPLKSWAFIHNGHPVRAEIWWRFSGWNRKRLYVDHRCVVARQGRFTCALPMRADLGGGAEAGKLPVQVRFRPRRLFFDMDCECTIGSTPIAWRETEVQIEWKRQHSASSDGMAGVVYDNQTLGCLIVFPLLAVLAIISGPLIMVGSAMWYLQERRRVARLRRKGRFLSWPQVEGRMRSAADATSTLIIEVGHMSPWRAWWTGDDLLAVSPLPLPNPMEMISPGRHRHPFVEWCQYRYLSETAGKAYLTELPADIGDRIKLFDERHDPHCCRELFPALNVVITGFTGGKRLKAAAAFASMLRDTLAQSVPNLIAGLEHRDATIREMSREAIALAGPDAGGGAVPVLARQFYVCPWEERYGVAYALAALGPPGVAVLKPAAAFGDPCLKRPATSALHIRRVRERERTRESFGGNSEPSPEDAG